MEVQENHTLILTFYLITEVTPRSFHSIINKTYQKAFIDMIYDTTAKSIFHKDKRPNKNVVKRKD